MNDKEYVKLHKNFTIERLEGLVNGLPNYLKKKRIKIATGTVKNKFTVLKRSGAIDQEKVEAEALKKISEKKHKAKTKLTLKSKGSKAHDEVINMTTSKNNKNTILKAGEINIDRGLSSDEGVINMTQRDYSSIFKNLKPTLELENLKRSLDLNDKHIAVADQYLILGKQVTAYLNVYPDCSYASASSSASEILTNPNIIRYMDYKKAMARTLCHVDFQRVVERTKVIAFYDREKNPIDSSLIPQDKLNEEDVNELASGGVPLTKKAKSFCTDVNIKPLIVKDANGFERVVHTKGYKFGHPYKGVEVLSALTNLKQILLAKCFDNSGFSQDPEVRELWERFQNQNKDDSITALDLANQLTKRNYVVPSIIADHAREEMRKAHETFNEGDIDISDVEYEKMEENWSQYKNSHQEQLKTFLPEREQEIQDLYKKHGYDEASKPVDEMINDSNLTDPGE
jgi:hypothetical protein